MGVYRQASIIPAVVWWLRGECERRELEGERRRGPLGGRLVETGVLRGEEGGEGMWGRERVWFSSLLR